MFNEKPSAKPGNQVPRVKVLNYLKKVALFFRFERDILADGAQVIGRSRLVNVAEVHHIACCYSYTKKATSFWESTHDRDAWRLFLDALQRYELYFIFPNNSSEIALMTL